MSEFEDIITRLGNRYKDLVLNPSGKSADKFITTQADLKLYDGKAPGDWELIDKKTKGVTLVKDVEDSPKKLIVLEFLDFYNSVKKEIQEKDPIENLKAGGFKGLGSDENELKTSGEEEKKINEMERVEKEAESELARLIKPKENEKEEENARKREENEKRLEMAMQAKQQEEEELEHIKKVKNSSTWNEGGFNKMKPETQHIQDAVFEDVEPANLPAPIGIRGIVRPAVSAAEALAAWKEFQALKHCIIEKSDIQTIQGKPFIKKSGWRKFATFYNLTDKIVEETQIPIEKGGFYWKIKVVCTAPNGRQTEGVGMCSSLEKSGARQLHDVYTTAHTRSKNRAISDMIAAGEVSAEEMA